MARRSEAPRSRPPNPSGVGLSDRAGLHRRLGWADRQRPSRSGGPENDGPFAVERPWLASEDRPQGRSLPTAGRKHRGGARRRPRTAENRLASLLSEPSWAIGL